MTELKLVSTGNNAELWGYDENPEYIIQGTYRDEKGHPWHVKITKDKKEVTISKIELPSNHYLDALESLRDDPKTP